MWAVCFSGWWSWCAVTSTGQLAMCHQSWTVKALKLSCHSSASSTSRMKQEVNQEWSTTNKPSSLLCCKQAQIFCNLNPWEKVCYLPLRNIQLHMFYTFWWEIFVLYPLSSCSWCIETILYCISNKRCTRLTHWAAQRQNELWWPFPVCLPTTRDVACDFFLMFKFIYHCACTKYNVYRNNIDIIDKHTDPPHQANRSLIIQVTIVH